MNELSRRGLRAAIAVAARHGVRCHVPVVLRDSSNLLVRLAPAPVVARVSTVTSMARPGDAWFAREVAIVSHLVAAGAPVVAPSAEIDPGPHHHDGIVLTFWTYLKDADRPVDAREAGRGLRVCHDALTSFGAELPRWAVLDEAQATLERLIAADALGNRDAVLLRRAGERVRADLDRLDPPLQPVHGDADLGNVLNGPDGPLWNDWEDCFLGPRAWDVGCLHAEARAFGDPPQPALDAHAGYGSGIDDETLDACVEGRRLQVAVWGLMLAHAQLHRSPWLERVLDHYRDGG